MDFGKALEAMKNGKKVRRPTMSSNQHIIYDNIYESKFVLVTLSEERLNCPVEYRFSIDDLLAEDWEIVEEHLPVKLQCRYYVICPLCKREFRISSRNNEFICGRCNKIFKIDKVNISTPYDNVVLDKYKDWLEKITNDMELEIMVSSRNSNPSNWRFSDSLSAFKQCLKMLTQLEVEASEQQRKETN